MKKAVYYPCNWVNGSCQESEQHRGHYVFRNKKEAINFARERKYTRVARDHYCVVNETIWEAK